MGRLPDIEQRYHLESSPAKVFAALTDPRILAKWFPARALFDPVKGGRFSLVMKNGFVWEGKLSGLKEGKSLSIPWVEGTASFEVVRRRKGTLLKLHHDGFESAENLVLSSAGWSYYLTNLKSVLDHGIDLRAKEDSF
jgi:uncharacterized protein YndB with AHSA1/START domain